MQLIALVVGGTSGTNWGRLELLVLAVAAVLAVALLVARSARSADRKKRRAAAVGYYDRDAAHYGPSAGNPSVERHEDVGPRAMAPSFVAPKHAGRGGSRPAPSVPTAPLPGFGEAGIVRAFDPVEAERLRPPAGDAGSDAEPPPPPPPSESQIPLLEMPPPPAPTAPPR